MEKKHTTILCIVLLVICIVFVLGSNFDHSFSPSANYHSLKIDYTNEEIHGILKDHYRTKNLYVNYIGSNKYRYLYSLEPLTMNNIDKETLDLLNFTTIGVNLKTGNIFNNSTGECIGSIGKISKEFNILTPEESILLLDRKLIAKKNTMASLISFRSFNKGNIIIKEQVTTKNNLSDTAVSFIINPVTRQVYDLKSGDFVFFLDEPRSMTYTSKKNL
ncbi:hypothetical protein [Anaeromicrobium sediminis]|uniref:Uncharacterized protein n=1 Tax=Anaeromicrobium sediminis TaxID=1478221 RepID=A0A267MN71_9FIRM|nr:hypothetical protein [Anaeromicrobium sediminis]PAB61051.1 hypothetical protein CCE28_01070 [Anaeromicrobium sediminis]